MTTEQKESFRILLRTMKTFLSMYDLSKREEHYLRYIDSTRNAIRFCINNNLEIKIPVYGRRYEKTKV